MSPARQPLTPPAHFQKLAHTCRIVAWDSVTGDLGIAVESKCPFMYWENYDVQVRMDGLIDRVVLDDILARRHS